MFFKLKGIYCSLYLFNSRRSDILARE